MATKVSMPNSAFFVSYLSLEDSRRPEVAQPLRSDLSEPHAHLRPPITMTSLRRLSGVTFRSTTLPFSTLPSTVVFCGAWSLNSQFQSFGQAGRSSCVLPEPDVLYVQWVYSIMISMATDSPLLGVTLVISSRLGKQASSSSRGQVLVSGILDQTDAG